MIMENQPQPEFNYLCIDACFSETGIRALKEIVAKRFANRVKDSFYSDFMNWEKNEKQLLVATFRAPEELPLFETLDCIFNKNDFQEVVFNEYKIVHSLCNGWVPAGTISRGNNHLLVLEFNEHIPETLDQLYVEDQLSSTAPLTSPRFGLCRSDDFREQEK
ncbi:hypothetical protein D3C87_95260 [compost metagenome]